MIRVLFVDDEPMVLAGLRRMLRSRRREWDMDFCASGDEALRSMERAPADVVVTDMRMPTMDGAELLGRIREGWPRAARLVLSGHSDQEMTLRAVGPAQQYLTKPCNADQLRASIARVVAIQSDIAGVAVRELVGAIESPPALPEAYLRLVEELASPAACVERAGRIIAADLGLAAKVLQLVNSSFFGLPVRVRDVAHAVALLGLGVVKPLVLSTGVFRQYEDRDLGGLNLARLVDHSTRVGMLAAEIARSETGDPETADEALLAGLMHDLGRLLLAQSRPGDYARLVAEADAGADANALERIAFGATHAEAGGCLLGMWGLPLRLVEAVALHHTPSRSTENGFTPLTAVHAAEALLDPTAEFDDAYLERLGLCGAAERWAAAPC